MKKILVLLLALAMIFAVSCAKPEPQPEPEQTKEPVAVEEKTEEVKEEPAEEVKEEKKEEKKEEAQVKYKDIMVPFDDIIPSNRIVILQNALNFTREGFYTEETKPATEDIDYNGGVAAYPITYAIDLLTNGVEGNVVVAKNDGSTIDVAADDFAGLYVVIDFESEDAVVLYNPETKTEITDFAYAVTEGEEAIYSVVSGSVHKVSDMLQNVGLSLDEEYRYIAQDKFHFPVNPELNVNGEVRGALSGTVNASFEGLKIAQGKLNDLTYIELNLNK